MDLTYFILIITVTGLIILFNDENKIWAKFIYFILLLFCAMPLALKYILDESIATLISINNVLSKYLGITLDNVDKNILYIGLLFIIISNIKGFCHSVKERI